MFNKIKKLIEDLKDDSIILYRGSEFDEEFGVGNYFSTSYNFSKDYGTVKKYKVELGRVFNILNPEHFNMLKEEVGEISDPYADEDNYPELLDIQEPSVIEDTGNTWEVTEQFLDNIKGFGFDSVEIWEDGIVNYIIFNPKERVVGVDNEDYVATATWYNPQSLVNRKLEVDVYKNSSYPEIARLLKESERGNLRFAMNSSEDYILWDADKMIHSSAIKHAKLQNEFDIKLDLLGIVFSTSNTGYKEVKEPCVYIYYGSANEFYNINAPMLTPWGSGTEENTEYVKEQFLKTHMYQSLKRAGINEVVVGSWL